MARDGLWTHASLFASIERHFGGAGALLLAGCCYSGGLAVEAHYEGCWYGAGILGQRLGVRLVRYDGFGDESDEWVSVERLRSAAPGASRATAPR